MKARGRREGRVMFKVRRRKLRREIIDMKRDGGGTEREINGKGRLTRIKKEKVNEKKWLRVMRESKRKDGRKTETRRRNGRDIVKETEES